MDAQSPSALRPLMRVVFRADASIHIGTGHVMRCLTLADALRAQGAQCRFICRPHQGNLLAFIAQRGHEAIALAPPEAEFVPPLSPTHASWLGTDWLTDAEQTRTALDSIPVDWLIVDHYALDQRWEAYLSDLYQNLMVIDDLADRPHACDLLLDQTLGRVASDYSGHVDHAKTQFLLGPRYALLRPEFSKWRSYSLQRRAKCTEVKQLLITMGGVDKDNATGKVLELLKSSPLHQDFRVTVVMGSHAPWLKSVQEQATNMPFSTQVLVGVNNMAQLMAESDLAIGAAGSTSWERCCLGLPCLVMVLAENQKEGASALQHMGAAIAIESFSDLPDILFNVLSIQQINSLYAMSAVAAEVTDGLGVEYVVNRIAYT